MLPSVLKNRLRGSTLAVRTYASTSSSSSSSSSSSPLPLPTKVLIANRGEIACRVMRTCKALGIKTVAVFSEADRQAMHVAQADEAYCIGPAPSAQSYLRMDAIIDVAKRTGAQMVHPGYGFLSENSAFANLLESEGLEFIGPPASAIESMGSKSASKEIMIAAGVPCVPGYHGKDQSVERLKKEADICGYPVLIKAVKGGGGKGMKIAMHAGEFEEQLSSARREAEKAFGDTDVLIERYLQQPRHVEVQVFADKHGNAVYVWERDCSVQRRHQKIIEEAPAPGLPEALRRELGEKAVAAARAVNYVGAGTVEFILDAQTLDFYFMEMNTRLQVEHPVSEAISGLDLVSWQLEVAAGNPLPLKQDEIPLIGHAFEARIYAENTRAGFLPDVGRLAHVKLPSGPGVRIDTGFSTGDEISVHYDPMIAKLIVHGRDRADALRRLAHALDEYEVAGPATNIDFLRALARHPAFEAGDVETGFIPKYRDELIPPTLPPPPPAAHIQAALFLALRDSAPAGPFASFRLSSSQPARRTVHFTTGAVHITPEATGTGTCTYTVEMEGQPTLTGLSAKLEGETALVTPGLPRASVLHHPNGKIDVFVNGDHVQLALQAPAWLEAEAGANANAAIIAPMPAKVVDVRVKPGDKVAEGDVLVVLEAMKTEHALRAPRDAVIKTLHNKAIAGNMVPEGIELVTFEEEESS